MNLFSSVETKPQSHKDVVKIDRSTGFAEFPQPGDVKKQMLPIYIDPEETKLMTSFENNDNHSKNQNNEDYWMPDKLCKICYACEIPFTMYRRRHHCRMCGQVFCNQCSSYYIERDDATQVRSCKLCYEQLGQGFNDNKQTQKRRIMSKKYTDLSSLHDAIRQEENERSRSVSIDNQNKLLSSLNTTTNTTNTTTTTTTLTTQSLLPSQQITSTLPIDGMCRLFETPESRDRHVSNLQNRASVHLESIVDLLVNIATNIEDNQKNVWKGIIVQLVREVVAFVDPDVRSGDSLDIRPYVKLKIIPGGSLQSNAFVNGVVFRKNVAHKKMATPKSNPRILLLGGGIDFQREDSRLSSLETLIEQEDKYTEILVEKILTLKPNIILVGKSVARKAQEMLCDNNVVVMQSVKVSLLERIARMTGAIMLPSTDHMIQQYGEECLGSCEKFYLRKITDCEWDETMPKKRVTPLKRITKDQQGVTYAYLEGCPAELGGTIILRGADRKTLVDVKRIISFSIMLAYHLRLEVSYYTDRCARLPNLLDVSKYEYESDDELVEPSILIKPNITTEDTKKFLCNILNDPNKRSLLSTSMDVDITLPHSNEIKGMPNHVFIKSTIDSVTPEDYQTLLVTSLLMTHNFVQRSRAEVKGIRYYTVQDVSLGQFLVESCFQLTSVRTSGRIMMLDHILSFIHRTGRIDISVSRTGGDLGINNINNNIVGTNNISNSNNNNNINNNNGNINMNNINNNGNIIDENQSYIRDPLQSPILMHSFCKECKAIVTPDVLMSEETWKMSFGKFMEMNFYNRSARCRTGGCSHFLRDDHVLFFFCEGYSARFEFVPIHPYSLHIRSRLTLPNDFHDAVTLNFLNDYTMQSDHLFHDFAQVLSSLEKLVTDVLNSRPEVLTLALSDIHLIENDIQATLADQQEIINSVMDMMSGARTSIISDDIPDMKHLLTKKFPLRLKRELMFKAANWNAKIDIVYRFIDSLESMVQSHNPTSNLSFSSIPELPEDEDLLTLRASLMQLSSAVGEIGEEDERGDNNHQSIQDDHLHLDDILEKRPILKGIDDKRASTRFVKAFARLLGKDNFKRSNFAVDMTEFTGGGRLGLPPGRLGRVIGVVEEELSTVIAYTLSSQEYYEQLQAFLKEDTNDLIVKDRPYKNEILSSPADFEPQNDNDVTGSPVENKLDTDPYDLNENNNEQNNKSEKLMINDNNNNSNNNNGNGNGNNNNGISNGNNGGNNGNNSSGNNNNGNINDNDISNTTSGTTNISNNNNNNGNNNNNQQQQQSQPESMIKKRKSAFAKTFQTLVKSDSPPPPPPEPSIPEIKEESDHPEEEEITGGRSDPFGFMSFNTTNVHFQSGDAYVTDGLSGTGDADSTIPTSILENSNNSNSLHDDRTLHQSIESEKRTDSSEYNKPISTREAILTERRKTHIKHRFSDYDEKNNITSKFICHIYWATQFQALRAEYLDDDDDEGYIRSLSLTSRWNAQGGKSGASFSRTTDNRFVVKHITRTELQMFLDFAPAYFDYMAKSFYHGLPTTLCKILGVYQIGYHNRVTGKKVMEQVVVMENLFFERNITKLFDLKGSSRARYVELLAENGEKADDFDTFLLKTRRARQQKGNPPSRVDPSKVCLDDNLMELTKGRPLPLKHKAKVLFHKAVMNDTLFLSIINIVDYSIVVGIDEDSHELVIGIIDYMRQYDIIKKMERMGKTVGTMIAGQAEPTVIQPPQYRKRFQSAMDRYFMTVPDKWIVNDI